jgi:hypothetical protein
MDLWQALNSDRKPLLRLNAWGFQDVQHTAQESLAIEALPPFGTEDINDFFRGLGSKILERLRTARAALKRPAAGDSLN